MKLIFTHAKTLSFVFVLLITGFLSCKKDGFSVTSSGLKYDFIEVKNGRKPVVGEMMRLSLKYKDKNNKVLYESDVLGDAFVLQLSKPTFTGGIEEGFGMMGEGDSAIFLLPADSIFDKTFHQVLPPSVSKGDFLRFEVRMKNVMTVEQFRKLHQAEKKSISQDQKNKIELYLEERNIAVQAVKEGIYFVVMKEGNGMKPGIGDSVEIRYTGIFLNGEVFDGSEKNGGNLKYVLGDGKRLEAWEQAISSMKVGTLARLVLSSENAFGKSGSGPVPPNTPVVYDIELIRVVPFKKAG